MLEGINIRSRHSTAAAAAADDAGSSSRLALPRQLLSTHADRSAADRVADDRTPGLRAASDDRNQAPPPTAWK